MGSREKEVYHMVTLFHASYSVIESPDIHYGRKNADFGQGFYTSDKYEFAGRWVTPRPDADIIINKYELDEKNLKIKRFDRDKEWFEYIFNNRRSMPDYLNEYDLIIGPIANDTIHDTLGVITSGFLSDEEAMKLLMVGNCYEQIVLKSENAAKVLKFISYEILTDEKIAGFRKLADDDNEKYISEFAKTMESFE